MKTITLTEERAKALESVLNKLIPAPEMLDKREITPTYKEVMAMIDVATQLSI